jgi:hypothetical protein
MRFTLNFADDVMEGQDLSYGLVFVPTPVWVRGADRVAVPDATQPGYQTGHLESLLVADPKIRALGQNRRATILVHQVGYGTREDLGLLVQDLEKGGFAVEVVAGAGEG